MNAEFDQAALAPEDRFCDLVMKGGITSGVVYPPAICTLARKYRFKNIGGTSAGAIAAALTAAAEYQRRREGSTQGFKLLEALPKELGEKGAGGKTKLLRLFQPNPGCRRLFAVLTGALNKGGTISRVAAILWSCMRAYWFATLASVALSAVFVLCRSTSAGIFCLLATLPTSIVIVIYRDFTRRVVGNNYGLCKGLTTTPASGAALTPWLHELIQKAAGRAVDDAPLTFGDLWNAPGFPPASFGMSEADGKGIRSIDLQMFTTNLTHGRPYIFPHVEPTARLFFNPEELKAYLPGSVLAWLTEHAIEYTSMGRSSSDPPVEDAAVLNLKEIPAPEHFPILLAARMSLSFPLLFAAVPLWAIDYEDARGKRCFRRCLFSDGGISSNFPMHLFDGLLPHWPTFGIQLEPELPGLPDNLLFLPHSYGQGIADRWTRFDQKQRAASRMGGFLTSIAGAMQNWNDNTLSRMPGVRDRVVRLRLNKDEGGMNLDMPPPLIKTIAERGQKAAELILARFFGREQSIANPEPGEAASAADEVLGTGKTPPMWSGWDFQRWVRLDVLLRTLADKAPGLLRALEVVPHATSYADLCLRGAQHAAPGHTTKMTPEQMQAVSKLIDALQDMAAAFKQEAPRYPNTPVPTPQLRVRPSL